MQITHPIYWLFLYLSINLFQLHLFYDFIADTLRHPRFGSTRILAVFGTTCFALTLLDLFLPPFYNLLLIQPVLLLLSLANYQDRPRRCLLVTAVFSASLWLGEAGSRLLFLINPPLDDSAIFVHLTQVTGLFFRCLTTFVLIKLYLILTADFFERLSARWFILFLLIPFSSMLICCVTYDLFRKTAMADNQAVLLTICGMALLLSNAAAFYLLENISRYATRSRDLYAMRLQSELEEKHYQLIQNKNEEYAEMIHDIKHHLRYLSQLSADEDLDGIREYLGGLQTSFASRSRGIYTENEVLNVILNEKASEASRRGIAFQTEITADIGFLGTLDQCTLMGNLLDNAIEGTAGCESPYIRLRIAAFNSGYTVVTVENSCNAPPTVKSGRLISRKGKDRRGLGLVSVSRIAEKTGGSMEYRYADRVFRTTVLLGIILPPEEEERRHLVSEEHL